MSFNLKGNPHCQSSREMSLFFSIAVRVVTHTKKYPLIISHEEICPSEQYYLISEVKFLQRRLVINWPLSKLLSASGRLLLVIKPRTSDSRCCGLAFTQVKNIWLGCSAPGSFMAVWRLPEAPFTCIQSIPLSCALRNSAFGLQGKGD